MEAALQSGELKIVPVQSWAIYHKYRRRGSSDWSLVRMLAFSMTDRIAVIDNE
jgi:hypothetical protein